LERDKTLGEIVNSQLPTDDVGHTLATTATTTTTTTIIIIIVIIIVIIIMH
jgi:hypothetical protein